MQWTIGINNSNLNHLHAIQLHAASNLPLPGSRRRPSIPSFATTSPPSALESRRIATESIACYQGPGKARVPFLHTGSFPWPGTNSGTPGQWPPLERILPLAGGTNWGHSAAKPIQKQRRTPRPRNKPRSGRARQSMITKSRLQLAVHSPRLSFGRDGPDAPDDDDGTG